MPIITNTSINITLTNFVDQCSQSELQRLAELLAIKLQPKKQRVSTYGLSILEHEWAEICSRLNSGRVYLSNEEEQTIKQIVQKLP